MEPLGLFRPNVKKLKSKNDVRGLIQALSYKKDPRIRNDAVRALGTLRDQRAMKPLLKALKDKDNSVRASAAEAVGRMGNPNAIEPLIVALSDRDHIVHSQAVGSLRRVGGMRAVSLLARLMAYGKEAPYRLMAANALADLGDIRAVDPLVEALRHEDSEVRCHAAWVLGKLGYQAGIGPLITALKDKDPQVCKRAAQALKQITDQNFGEDASEWQRWWYRTDRQASILL